MLDSDLLLAASSIAFEGFHLSGKGSGELVERPLCAVLLR
jgi:hypothetical protein